MPAPSLSRQFRAPLRCAGDGRRVAAAIGPGLAKAALAVKVDGKLGSVDRDRARRQVVAHHPQGPGGAGTDPPRHRACAGQGGAGAVPGHPGDHRPGDRGRLLLRLRARRAVHAGRPAQDRSEDARDRRARPADPARGLAARRGGRALQGHRRELQGRADPAISARAKTIIDLLSRRLARPLPRAALRLDRQDRPRLQADQDRRRLLARRSPRTRSCSASTAPPGATRRNWTPICTRLEEAEKRDHRSIGREMDLFHMQEEAVGQVFWHPEGLDALSHARGLYPPPARARRLSAR